VGSDYIAWRVLLPFYQARFKLELWKIQNNILRYYAWKVVINDRKLGEAVLVRKDKGDSTSGRIYAVTK